MDTAETPGITADDLEAEEEWPGVEEDPTLPLRVIQKRGSLSKSGMSSKILASSEYLCFDSCKISKKKKKDKVEKTWTSNEITYE